MQMQQIVLSLSLFLPSVSIFASPYYGSSLCAYPQYTCIKITGGQSWQKLFPDPEKRDLVQRLNRTYNDLWTGKTIAVPVDLKNATMYSLSPFPTTIGDKEKQIIVDQDKLAWVAYENGKLVKWGPISSGRDRCSDSSNSCRTLTGIYHFFSKENAKCRSAIFPIGRGGAEMPWCMYYHKGFALHGANDIPGYRASHGCVRLFTQDAYWLNNQFVSTGDHENNVLGTKVTIRPVNITSKEESYDDNATTDTTETTDSAESTESNDTTEE
ncbi:MAG: endopeptidase IV [Legionellales bacterium RIFCSPHIGHO2_12_FULL_37_14]|nr:MAG: endopeptidase IV [Legionellales bacterium RIFCSPHIGHO2_12_FULL_37_14]